VYVWWALTKNKGASRPDPRTSTAALRCRHSGAYSDTAGEGKFFFTMMAAFAELERDMVKPPHQPVGGRP
jgi:hypothetical protein